MADERTFAETKAFIRGVMTGFIYLFEFDDLGKPETRETAKNHLESILEQHKDEFDGEYTVVCDETNNVLNESQDEPVLTIHTYVKSPETKDFTRISAAFSGTKVDFEHIIGKFGG